ncbi:MAG: hypothetical protein Q7S22_02750 [Candidatus Micrarchaeota archaeon]|nr:hypothetical protein [Candidatus Micrarchaeota archaeon]
MAGPTPVAFTTKEEFLKQLLSSLSYDSSVIQVFKEFEKKKPTIDQKLEFVKLVKIISNNSIDDHTLIQLKNIVKHLSFKPEMIGKFQFIFVNAQDSHDSFNEFHARSNDVLSAIGSLFENPNFKSEMLTEQFIAKLLDTIKLLSRDNRRDDRDIDVFSKLNQILVNERFNPEKIDLILFVAQNGGIKSLGALKVLIVESPAFKSEMLDASFVEKLCAAVKFTKDIGGRIFQFVLINPNFRVEMLNESFLVELRKLAKNVLSGLDRNEAPDNYDKLGVVLAANENLWLIQSVNAHYSEGKKLANELSHNSFNAFHAYRDPLMYMNFAYAIATIGESKTRELYAKLGIEYFMRYKPETLEIVYTNLTSSKENQKPVLLVAFNKNDHNGAFYFEGMRLKDLGKYYRLFIVEVDSEKDFYGKVSNLSSTFGKINTLVIGGHGKPDLIKLGKTKEEGGKLTKDEAYLNLTDEEDMQSIRRYLVSAPTVILVSCSTGENQKSIGALLSRVWDARLYAPSSPSLQTFYDLNREGKITGVSYNVVSPDPMFMVLGLGDSHTEINEFLKGVKIKKVK